MNTHRLSTGIFTLLFLGAMFGGLFHMGTDMTGSMTDCLFMSEIETVCPMNAFEHLGAWQSVFTVSLTSSILLLLLAGTLVGVASIAPHMLRKILYADPPLLTSIRALLNTFPRSPLQELFSRGILHPKLF